MKCSETLRRVLCCSCVEEDTGGESWLEPERDNTTASTTRSPVHSQDSPREGTPRDDLAEGDGGMEDLVEDYESCLRRYDLLESDLLVRGESKELLLKIREDPHHVVDEEMGGKGEVIHFVNEAKHLKALEEQIQDMRYVTGEGELVESWVSNNAEEKQEEGDEDTARKSTSVGRNLINKLKKIDATQGTLSMPKRHSLSPATVPPTITEESTLPSFSTPSSAAVEKKSRSTKYVLHVKPKWPEWLVDESYEVIKVTKYGIKYNRSLKLTQYHVLASSEDKGVTKVYSYLDLVDVRVLVESNQEERLTLVFKSKSAQFDLYNYMTPMAAVIANQVTTRLKIRRALGAARDNGTEADEELQLAPGVVDIDPSLTDTILKSITSANTKSKTSAVIAFAESLVENLVPTRNETDIKGDRSSVRDRTTSRPSPNGPASESVLMDAALTPAATTAAAVAAIEAEVKEENEDENLAQYLMVVRRHSPEFYVQQAVERVLHKGPSAEHDTRAHFLESVREKVSKAEALATSDGGRAADAILKEMRMFIEGLHEYLLLKRGQSLATIHVWGSQLQETPPASPASAGDSGAGVQHNIPPASVPGPSPYNSSSSSSSTSHLNARRSPSVLVTEKISPEDLDRILDRHLQHARINKGANGGEEEEHYPLAHLRYHTLLSISYITYSVVEESIFAELKPHVVVLIGNSDDVRKRDTMLTAKIRSSLCQRSQEDWGIPESNCSPLGWAVAVNELNTLDAHNTPSTKLSAIVVAAKNIFAEYATVKGEGADAIGADDLVPIFIYVLAQTGLENILATCNLLWKLCHPSLLHGESGYYLTVFESAASFLEEYNTEKNDDIYY